jgi:hypothetical protein
MKKICLTLLVAGLFCHVHAQSPVNVDNPSPLAVFFEESFLIQKPTYLLEKNTALSPDIYLEETFSKSKFLFGELTPQQTEQSLEQWAYPASEETLRVFGQSLEKAPVLTFYQNKLARVQFHYHGEVLTKKQLLNRLTYHFGKPETYKYALTSGIVKEYKWKGYKLDICLFTGNGHQENGPVVIVEDKLLMQVAEAELQNRKFVKEPMLYSDVLSLFR